MTFMLRNRGVLYLTDDFDVGDLWMEPDTRLFLNGFTLKIHSSPPHALDGTIDYGDPSGTIRWRQGTIFLIR